MRVHRLEQIVQCPLMHSPIGLLHCRRHLFKSISQWHLFPALIGRELFSSPALHFSACKCIDPRADTIICSDFHVRVTLRVEGYGVRRTNMLRVFFEVKQYGRRKPRLGVFVLPGRLLRDGSIQVNDRYPGVCMEMHGISGGITKTLMQITPC